MRGEFRLRTAMKLPNTVALTRAWLTLAALLGMFGWVLSWLGRLDATGYLVAGPISLLAAGVALFSGAPAERRRFLPSRFARRFRRLPAAVFLLLAVLALVGGALYEPNNYDGLTYRFPRLLHWLAEHRWHWISTSNQRMNISGTGFEWLMAPLLLATRSSRFFFLINVFSYLLLPGLAYAVFIRVGISRRVAWFWMWLAPCGYCFALQAGSIGNDGFSACYLLASLFFALKARESRCFRDLAFSILAVALLTSPKASNLPIVLPWFVAFLAAGWAFLKNPGSNPGGPSKFPLRLLAGVGLIALAVCSSFAPTALLNLRHCGQWAGSNTGERHLEIEKPLYGLVGNALQLITRNAMPPVMPLAKAWNEKTSRWKELPAFQTLAEEFPRLSFSWNELEQEESAGLGFGLFVLTIATAVAALRMRTSEKLWPIPAEERWGVLVCLAGWISLFGFMAKLGSEAGPRIAAPYYFAVLMTVMLLPGSAQVVRRRWWRNLAALAAVSTVPVAILTPSRPLWPAVAVFDKLASQFPGNRLIQRGRDAYAVYRTRADCLAPLRKHIAEGERAVFFVGMDAPEVALWRPFGSHRVIDVSRTAPLEPGRHPSLVFASESGLEAVYKDSMEKWIVAIGGRTIAKEEVVTKLGRGAETWWVIRTGTAGMP